MIKIKPISSVSNPNSIHGIYPYRGKISAIEARNIVKQIPTGSVLLDPFCGTGTIVFEGIYYGIRSIGVDMNPIAIMISKGKIHVPPDINEAVEETSRIINKAKNMGSFIMMPDSVLRHFDITSAEEISRTASCINEMSDYVKACFLGAIALVARGCNHYRWTSTSVGKDINPKRYIPFYEKFMQKVKKHYYPSNSSLGEIYEADARNLSSFIGIGSIDYVFTSPPYFDCLDYTAYYNKIIYEIIGSDRLAIKKNLIQSYNTYEEDMQIALAELHKVCRVGAKIIFVVGDKKVRNKVINGADFFDGISPFKKIDVFERGYTGSSSKVFDSINKTDRKEQIIIWEKR